MEQPKLHAGYMEVAVAMLLNYRVYTIVPNVSFGIYLNHECDLLALKDNRFLEVEIKISAQDLRKDFEKKHNHRSEHISRLAYAVPEKLIDLAKELCPAQVGIIGVKWHEIKYSNNPKATGHYSAYWVRLCRSNKWTQPVPKNIQSKFMSLGCMRIWSLKSKLYKINK